MIEILPELRKDAKEPLYLQLYRYIKGEIEKGTIHPEDKLPSIRALSDKTGISITTVRTAYDQLMMEGYIQSQEKSGYYVSRINFIKDPEIDKSQKTKVKQTSSKIIKNLYDSSCFDFIKWKKCISHILTYDTNKLLAEADFQGEKEFREQIRKYIFQSRGVHAEVENIVVGSGTQQIMNLLASILKTLDKNAIGFENPGYMMSELIFRNQNFDVADIELDKEGLMISSIKKNLDLLYVSPSHQFPTGIVMSASRRMQLLSWANSRDGYIIEDDYDSELRYYGKPIPSLKAMDKNDRVIHMGSFSATLLPSIRISYVVLPQKLLEVYKKIKASYAQGVSKVDQLTLTKFMEEGHYQRHIKRIRRLYSEKSGQLSEFLEQNYPGEAAIISNTSGLFIILDLDSAKNEEKISEIFRSYGIKATPYKNYVKTRYKPQRPRILLYFYNIEKEHLNKIVSRGMREIAEKEINEKSKAGQPATINQ